MMAFIMVCFTFLFSSFHGFKILRCSIAMLHLFFSMFFQSLHYKKRKFDTINLKHFTIGNLETFVSLIDHYSFLETLTYLLGNKHSTLKESMHLPLHFSSSICASRDHSSFSMALSFALRSFRTFSVLRSFTCYSMVLDILLMHDPLHRS